MKVPEKGILKKSEVPLEARLPGALPLHLTDIFSVPVTVWPSYTPAFGSPAGHLSK